MHAVRERLKQLLILILEALAEDGRRVTPDVGLREALQTAGIDAEDVVGLLAWFEDQPPGAAQTWLTSRSVQLPARWTVRLQTEEERRYLSPGAFGYLLRLRGDGQISWQQLETVVQVASLAGDRPLEREELGEILEHVLVSMGPTRLQTPAPGLQAH
jgi:uncharacterized protein Smg (DUF494 family)